MFEANIPFINYRRQYSGKLLSEFVTNNPNNAHKFKGRYFNPGFLKTWTKAQEKVGISSQWNLLKYVSSVTVYV